MRKQQHAVQPLLIKYTQRILTGGARAASIIELIPHSGVCNRHKSPRNLYAKQDIIDGTSRMMLVCTTPGSTALFCKTQQKRND